MPNTKKPFRWKFKALLFLIVAAAVGWWYLKRQQTDQDRDTLIARIEALSHMLNTTEGKEKIGLWDAGAFVPNDAINQALDLLVDKPLIFTVDIERLKLKGDIEVKLKSAKLDSEQGTGLGAAEIEIAIPQLKTNLVAKGSAWFGVKAIFADKDDPGRQSLVPILRFQDFRPKADIGDFGFSINGQTADVLSAPLMQEINLGLAEAFEKGILLPKPKDFELRHESTGEVDTGSAKVAFSYQLAGAAIPIPWRFSTFAIVPEGIWLLLSDGNTPNTQHPDRSERTLKDLSTELEKLEGEWKSVAESLKPSTPESAQLWVSRRIFERMGQEIGTLPEPARQFKMTSQGASGPLYKDRWWDKILGEGGVEVGVASAQGLQTVVTAGQPAVAWSADTGLSLTVPYSAKNDSQLHFHVDPLIGGGVGTTIRCEGRSDGSLSLQARLETIRRDEVEGVGLVLTSKTPGIEVVAETDGKFKIDWGWTKVPKVGAIVKMPLPEKVLPPFLLCDNNPLPTFDLALPEKFKQLRWKAASPIIGAKLQAFEVTSNADGVMVAATPKIESVTKVVKFENWLASRDREIQEWGKNWKSFKDEAKAQKATFILTVGKMDFGPNNDLVAFLRAVGKPLETINDLLKKAGIDVGKDKILEWIGNPSDALKNSDAGKALVKVEAEAKALADKAKREAEELARKIEDEARKARENLIEKPVNWAKKRLGF